MKKEYFPWSVVSIVLVLLYNGVLFALAGFQFTIWFQAAFIIVAVWIIANLVSNLK